MLFGMAISGLRVAGEAGHELSGGPSGPVFGRKVCGSVVVDDSDHGPRSDPSLAGYFPLIFVAAAPSAVVPYVVVALAYRSDLIVLETSHDCLRL